MQTEKPLIGITTRHDLSSERFYLARYYSEAVEACGGAPVLIPLLPREGYVGRLAEVLDGVLLPGSASDMDPLLYGREPHQNLKEVHPLRDETDLLLLKAVEERAVPLLAICYGMQALNVWRGGTLIQDINSSAPRAVKHEQGAPRERASHTISILPGSLLSELAGAESLAVNSHHHQALEHLGENLRATAWTEDGLVEAVEDTRGDRWAVGVQWHPELDWERSRLSRSLFEAFVSSCRLRRASGGRAEKRGRGDGAAVFKESTDRGRDEVRHG
jgi:putative glutamine amidotransferase